MPVLRITFQIN